MDRLSYLAPGSWANLRQDRTDGAQPTNSPGQRPGVRNGTYLILPLAASEAQSPLRSELTKQPSANSLKMKEECLRAHVAAVKKEIEIRLRARRIEIG